MRRILSAFLVSGFLCPLALFAQNLDWKTASSYTKKTTKEQLQNRLQSYVEQDTDTTANQLKFAKNLVKELRQYGFSAVQEKNGLVLVEIPANVKANIPEVLFVAATQSPATKVAAQLHENYKGGEVTIQASARVALDAYNAPQLTHAYGHTLMTASGSTALGAGTKSGAAIAMQVAEFLDAHPAVSHGPITLAFVTGKESVQTLFSRKKEVPYVYVLQGAMKGEITNQTFSTRSFHISFEGNRQIPLGNAMNSPFVDNLLIASDFHSLLPRANRPETTSGTRGFIYVSRIAHAGDKTEIEGSVAAFSKEEMQQLEAEVSRAFATVKAMHNKAKNFTLTWKDGQQNIQGQLSAAALLLAEKAMQTEEITPKYVAARTQTESTLLAANGFSVPSLFTGHYNGNTTLEYVDVDEMEASFRTAMRIISSLTIQEMRK